MKCPFHVRDVLPKDEKVEGEWLLKRDHFYFYQVQTQLHVCRLPYADFLCGQKLA